MASDDHADAVAADATFRDPSATTAERVADLLARMTVEEKLAQLGSVWVFEVADDDGVDTARAADLLAHGIGQVTRIGGATNLDAVASARLANDLQDHLRRHTRLGVPAIVHEEICSGLMAREAATFPQAIGVASTFRPEHNRAMADVIRRQMRAVGAHHGLSPVLDVARDARWGRLEETYGEDPTLVGRMGVAFVEGLQGAADPAGSGLADGVVATAKHFVGYGASEGGMNWAPAHLGQRELRDTYLRPFEHAVREAGLASVMNAYHEIDGVPCGADRWLLTELLRDEWGFEGTVVSDYFAIDQLRAYHHVAEDKAGAAAMALHAGIDVELPTTDAYGKPLLGLLERGEVDLEAVDAAVARVLRQKLELGLFEAPTVDTGALAACVRTPEQLALATDVAHDSLVLLRNDGVLPLGRGRSLAVIGPNADDPRNLFGDYSYVAHVESLADLLDSGDDALGGPVREDLQVDTAVDLGHVTTILAGLRDRMPDGAVTDARGCDVRGEDRSGFDEAVRLAAGADVAVLVVGGRSGLTDECTSGESRDVTSLDLPGVQEELVLAVAATGTPVVLVLVDGRPIGSPAVHEAAAAVLVAWLPGEQGGVAVADALLGVRSPGGKLPVSYPRSSGQVPVFYGHKPSGGRSHWKGPYVDCSNEPLHPFGFGLTYSTFALDLGVGSEDPVTVGPGDVVDVAMTLANTGGARADEVVQLYVRDPVATVVRPVLELVDFVRVGLDPGERVRVTFRVPVDALAATGLDLDLVLEPGELELLVGTSSDDVALVRRLVVGGDGSVAVPRTLARDVTVEPA